MRRFRLVAAIAVAAPLALAACSGGGGGRGSSGNLVGSCDTPVWNECNDYSNPTPAAVRSTYQGVCELRSQAGGAVWSAGACPTANRIGSCTYPAQNGSYQVTRYYTGADPTGSQSACVQAGATWTAN